MQKNLAEQLTQKEPKQRAHPQQSNATKPKAPQKEANVPQYPEAWTQRRRPTRALPTYD